MVDMILDFPQPAVLEPAEHGLLVLHDPTRFDVLGQARPVFCSAFADEAVYDRAFDDGRVARPFVPAASPPVSYTFDKKSITSLKRRKASTKKRKSSMKKRKSSLN